jgi:actin related protein 2/3 complex subunit 3
VHGHADFLLIYLTLFTVQCLGKLTKKTKADATTALNLLALNQFALPGDKDFVLGGFVTAPANEQDRRTLQQYLAQCRQEFAIRLITLVYGTGQQPSKWWMCFAKQKFLNKSL